MHKVEHAHPLQKRAYTHIQIRFFFDKIVILPYVFLPMSISLQKCQRSRIFAPHLSQGSQGGNPLPRVCVEYCCPLLLPWKARHGKAN